MRGKRGLVVAGGMLAVLLSGGVWAGWLVRRQRHWRRTLAERIPVHSAYWRARRTHPGALLYVALGDSAAQGIGASRPDRSYVGVIAHRLRERIGVPVRVVNLAVSGATLRTAIETQLPRLAQLRPDVVTVGIGANDIAAFEPGRFASELDAVLDALPPHTIVAELPSFYLLPGERRVREANRILRAAVAARGLALAPLHAATARQGLRGITTQFAGDLFHPNDRGYRVWADAFEPALAARAEQLRADGRLDAVGAVTR